MNVLILDDDKTVCDVIKEHLERAGFICMTSTTVEEARLKSKVLKFDILIADLLLSGPERGDQFAKEFRKRNPWAKIAIMTGSERPENLEIDPDKLFLKPVDFNKLLSYLNSSPQSRPQELTIESVKLNDRDMMLMVNLVNKVVEHTNIVATTQSLITENLEELGCAVTRLEEKLNFIYVMLKKVDDSGILRWFSLLSGFLKSALTKIFWAIVGLIGMWILRNPLLSFINAILKQ